jgi:hypothetical protein
MATRLDSLPQPAAFASPFEQQHPPQPLQTLSPSGPVPANPARHPKAKAPKAPKDAVWTNSKPPLPRGRAPKDPNASRAKFQCNSLLELETVLRSYLDSSPANPERSTCEITLLATASLSLPKEALSSHPPNKNQHTHESDVQPESVSEAVSVFADPKDTMMKQRLISKLCILAIQSVDGFRYSFHNNWKSGEENAYRFSYYCNDSLLNKDRVANGKAGTQGRRATKPVYDCKGGISIKFSSTRQCVDVIYKHVPCHPTYAQRAPIPRKDAKRRAEWEAENQDRVRKSVSIGAATAAATTAAIISSTANTDTSTRAALAVAATALNTGSERPAKRRKSGPPKPTPKSTTESQLREQSMSSLLELIRTDKESGPHKTSERPRGNDLKAAANQVLPVSNQVLQNGRARPPPPPIQPATCAICLQRRLKCDGKRPDCSGCSSRRWPCWYAKPGEDPKGPPQAQVEANNEALPAAVTKQVERLHKENEQMDQRFLNLQQLLEGQKDEFEKLRTQFKESQDRTKQLETQLQEKAVQEKTLQERVALQEKALQDRALQDKAMQEKASQAQAASQRPRPQSTTAYQPQPHPMPPARLNPTYQPHEPERPLSQAFPPMTANRKFHLRLRG